MQLFPGPPGKRTPTSTLANSQQEKAYKQGEHRLRKRKPEDLSSGEEEMDKGNAEDWPLGRLWNQINLPVSSVSSAWGWRPREYETKGGRCHIQWDKPAEAIQKEA